ncbi:MAG: hypothetical protein EPO28_12685 [Saprospiraceae bacterium]|nr:MAG: hypothetical protein EPO28_12685 [Saprospiraceae bacterium]
MRPLLPFLKLPFLFAFQGNRMLLATIAALLMAIQFAYSQGLQSSGYFKLQSFVYHAENIEPRYQNFTYTVSGNYSLAWENFKLPLSFIFSDRQQPYRQPFNRSGIAPTWSWGKAQFGYGNMRFSPFTLAGVTFLGAGFDINPGKFRLGAMAGRLNREIRLDSFATHRQTPSFARTGYALKLGVGSEKNFFDLVFFKAKDHVGSLPDFYTNSILQAKENMALGATSRFLFAEKWALELDAAVSAFTRDAGALETEVRALNFLKSFFPARLSTTLLTAGQAAFGYQSRDFGLKLQYHRVEPGYQTMGAYFFQSDVENLTLNARFNAAQRKLRFQGSFGLQRDNLFHHRFATTHRLIGSARVFAQPSPKYGVDFAFFNYGVQQQTPPGLLQDTVLFSQVNQSFLLTNRFTFLRPEVLHNFVFTNNYQVIHFEQGSTFDPLTTRIFMTNLHYLLQWQLTGWGISTNLNFLRSVQEGAALAANWPGFAIGVSKNFPAKGMAANLTASLTQAFQGGEKKSDTWMFSAFGSVRLAQRHSLFVQAGYLKNSAPEAFNGLSTFSEFRGNVGVNLSIASGR